MDILTQCRKKYRKLGSNTYAEAATEIEKLRKQHNELLEAFKSVKVTLDAENLNGNIIDTLWYSDFETLFDYMDSVLERYK